MKSFAGPEELQASFRAIGLALTRAESRYFWFGNLGRTSEDSCEQASVYSYLKQELVGIKSGDLELYLEDLRQPGEDEGDDGPAFPDYLSLQPEAPPAGKGMLFYRLFWSHERRRAMFEEAIDREVRRRHGESDDGDTPIPAGYPLRASSAVK